MIINIRGTHGSGKSTVVRSILERYPHEVLGKDKKPDGYKVQIPWLTKPVFVVGSYKTDCGGCDAIQPYALIWPRVEAYAKQGHVVFEGALVSSCYGNIGRASEVYGDDFVFAFMDTPLEECLNRIRLRREAKGNFTPLNPKSTSTKFRQIAAYLPKVSKEYKRRVVILNHKSPLAKVLGLLKNA